MSMGQKVKVDVCTYVCIWIEFVIFFSRAFCYGWVIITSFSWRLRRHFLCLFYVGASFSISQVIVGEMFMSFRHHKCVDKELYTILMFIWLHFSIFSISLISVIFCLMIVVYKSSWNLWSQTSFHAIEYI